MKKRILALILASVMVLGLVSCGGESKDQTSPDAANATTPAATEKDTEATTVPVTEVPKQEFYEKLFEENKVEFAGESIKVTAESNGIGFITEYLYKGNDRMASMTNAENGHGFAFYQVGDERCFYISKKGETGETEEHLYTVNDPEFSPMTDPDFKADVSELAKDDYTLEYVGSADGYDEVVLSSMVEGEEQHITMFFNEEAKIAKMQTALNSEGAAAGEALVEFFEAPDFKAPEMEREELTEEELGSLILEAMMSVFGGAEEQEKKDYGFVTEPVVLEDNDTYTFRVDKIEGNEFGGFTMDLYAENKTDKPVRFQADEGTVNGWSTLFSFEETVEAKENVLTTVYIGVSDLEISGTEVPEVITFDFHAYDEEDEPIDEKVLTFYPTGKTAEEIPAFERRTSDTEKVVTDDEYVQFVILGEAENQEPDVFLETFIENKTEDKYLNAILENVKVNGVEIDPYWEYFMTAGMKKYSYITIWSEDLEENEIDEVKTIEGELVITDVEDPDKEYERIPFSWDR